MSADTILAAISLGGNVGDVRAAFRNAIDIFKATPGVRVMRQSQVFETMPWGVTEQPVFLNMVLLLAVTIPARAVLNLCLDIERRNGRTRDIRWGPRSLDLDVLIYGNQHYDEPGLCIPHARLAERAFVLAPLAEVAPDLVVDGRDVCSLLAGVDTTGITPRGEL